MSWENKFIHLLSNVRIAHQLNLTKETLYQDILISEESLNIKLSESYKIFMLNYGYTMFEGFEIKGLYTCDLSAVEATLYYRKYKLPEEYVVIQVDGTDWIYCLDTKNIVDNECPVVEWSIGEVEGIIVASNFYEFLKEQISEYYEIDID